MVEQGYPLLFISIIYSVWKNLVLFVFFAYTSNTVFSTVCILNKISPQNDIYLLEEPQKPWCHFTVFIGLGNCNVVLDHKTSDLAAGLRFWTNHEGQIEQICKRLQKNKETPVTTLRIFSQGWRLSFTHTDLCIRLRHLVLYKSHHFGHRKQRIFETLFFWLAVVFIPYSGHPIPMDGQLQCSIWGLYTWTGLSWACFPWLLHFQ